MGRARFLKRLLYDLPRNLKLAYCLMLDPRVPLRNKAALGAALALIVTPYINLPAWIPVVGEMDMLALTLVASRLFIGAAPDDVVVEHERLIRRRQSRFDQDVERGRRFAVALSRRLPGHHDEAPAPEPVATPTAAAPMEPTRPLWSWGGSDSSQTPAAERASGVTR